METVRTEGEVIEPGLYCLPGTAVWLLILSRLSPDVPI
jgi:hypothetical protein